MVIRRKWHYHFRTNADYGTGVNHAFTKRGLKRKISKMIVKENSWVEWAIVFGVKKLPRKDAIK